MSDHPPSLNRATLVSGLVLVLPPLLALLAGLFPGSVPIPFVDTPESDELRPLLLVLGVFMLALNAAVLWGLHRMVRQ